MDAKAAIGIGSAMNVKDYRHVLIFIATSGVGAGESVTAKCQASIEDVMPDFAATQSISNIWDYMQLVEADSGLTVDGSTGVTANGSEVLKLYSVNTDGMTWVNFNITALSGTLSMSIKAVAYND